MFQAIYQQGNNGDDLQHRRSNRKWISRSAKQETKRDAAEKARKEFEITMHLMASLAMSGVDPNPKKKEFDASQYDDNQSLESYELTQRFKRDFPNTNLKLSNAQLRDRYRSTSSSLQKTKTAIKSSNTKNQQDQLLVSQSPQVLKKCSNPDLKRRTTSSPSLRKVRSFQTTSIISRNFDMESEWKDHLGLTTNKNASRSAGCLQSKQSTPPRERVDIDSVLSGLFQIRNHGQPLSSSSLSSRPNVEDMTIPPGENNDISTRRRIKDSGLPEVIRKASLRSFKLGSRRKTIKNEGQEFLMQESSSSSNLSKQFATIDHVTMNNDRQEQQDRLAQQIAQSQDLLYCQSSFKKGRRSESDLVKSHHSHGSQNSLSSHRMRGRRSRQIVMTSSSSSSGSLSSSNKKKNKNSHKKSANADLLKRWEEQTKLKRQQQQSKSQVNEVFTTTSPSSELSKSEHSRQQRSERSTKNTTSRIKRHGGGGTSSSDGGSRRKERARLRRVASAKNFRRNVNNETINSDNPKKSCSADFVLLLQQEMKQSNHSHGSATSKTSASTMVSLSTTTTTSSSSSLRSRERGLLYARGLTKSSRLPSSISSTRPIHQSDGDLVEVLQSKLRQRKNNSSSQLSASNCKGLNGSKKNSSSLGDISPHVMSQVKW